MFTTKNAFPNAGSDYLPILTCRDNGCIRWHWQNHDDLLAIQLQMLHARRAAGATATDRFSGQPSTLPATG